MTGKKQMKSYLLHKLTISRRRHFFTFPCLSQRQSVCATFHINKPCMYRTKNFPHRHKYTHRETGNQADLVGITTTRNAKVSKKDRTHSTDGTENDTRPGAKEDPEDSFHPLSLGPFVTHACTLHRSQAGHIFCSSNTQASDGKTKCCTFKACEHMV